MFVNSILGQGQISLWRQDTVATSNPEELLARQDRDLVEEFINGHDIGFPVSVYVGNGERSETKACGKIPRGLKGPIAVSMEGFVPGFVEIRIFGIHA